MEVKTGEVKTDEVKTDEVKTDEVKTDEVQAGKISIEDQGLIVNKGGLLGSLFGIRTVRRVIHGKIKVDWVQIEFYEGFIENIIATASTDTTFLKFENNYPIGFSSKDDYQTLNYIYLSESTGRCQCQLKLGDLITYIQNSRIKTRDYSPKNSVREFIPPVKK